MPRVAVVTGGAGAIGGAIARRLELDGHVVEIIDRDTDPPCDLADAGQVRDAAERIVTKHGRCDVLVHAAAAFDRARLDDIELATWVQAVNVESAVVLCQALAPSMRACGFGRIVFVVSDTVWSPPGPDMLAYVTSKAALVGLARSLAVALGGDGIAVSAVAPGLTRTPASSELPAEAFAAVEARQALPRPLVPDDVASAVAFLVSDAAAALTGQTLCVDGGLVLR